MATRKRSEGDPEEIKADPNPQSQGPAVALSQEQFAELLNVVRESGQVPNIAPPPEPELDLANDPNVWTWDRVRALMDKGEVRPIEFVPQDTCRIGWNGLYVHVCKDVKNVVPEMHFNVYMESRQGTIDAFKNAEATLAGRSGAGMYSVVTGWNPDNEIQKAS